MLRRDAEGARQWQRKYRPSSVFLAKKVPFSGASTRRGGVGALSHYLPTPPRPTLFGMEAEVVEDKRKATPCDCGHPAGLHGLTGVGHCTAAGCDCKGLAVTDDEATPADGSLPGVPVVRFGLRALNGASPVAGPLDVPSAE